jgi:hypothetical protein
MSRGDEQRTRTRTRTKTRKMTMGTRMRNDAKRRKSSMFFCIALRLHTRPRYEIKYRYQYRYRILMIMMVMMVMQGPVLRSRSYVPVLDLCFWLSVIETSCYLLCCMRNYLPVYLYSPARLTIFPCPTVRACAHKQVCLTMTHEETCAVCVV